MFVIRSEFKGIDQMRINTSKNIQQEFETLIQDITSEVKLEASKASYTATGYPSRFISAIGYTIVKAEQKLKGTVACFGKLAKYFDILEDNKKPYHMPPKGVLIDWMVKVKGESYEDALLREYAVAKVLAEKGFKGGGRHIIKNVYFRVRERITNLLGGLR